ncbi:MAG: DMT family transporter [Acidobacteriota bacterium]|nr:DMT family transporter [Acidobacteriota bacterium]
MSLAGVTVIWGATFVLVKAALDQVSTPLFLALRFSVAAAALTIIYRRGVRRNGIAPGLLAGGLLFVAYFFQTKGLEYTTASKSAFLTGLSIPMVPLASSAVYRSKPRLFEVAGVLTASAGMAMMTLPSGRFEMSRGDVLSFLCAVTFALHIVVVGHFSPIVGFQSIAVLQVAMAAVLGVVSFPFTEPVRFAVSGTVIAAVLVTGLLATALAFTTMAWAQQYTSATRAALIFALEPVVAWVTSWFSMGETLSLRAKVGAAVILAGVLLVELKRGEPETKVSAITSN